MAVDALAGGRLSMKIPSNQLMDIHDKDIMEVPIPGKTIFILIQGPGYD